MSSRPGKAAASSSSSSQNKHKKPAKKVKPELSIDEQVRKKWKSLKDQVKEGYNENGLKTCTKILQLQPANDLAQRTYIQLLLNLDRYKEALAWITEDAERLEKWNIEQCYALYKLGREREADEVLQKSRDSAMDEDTTRTLDVLDAQIKYRLEQFSESQQLYEDLLATVETDSPEYDDLSTNLSACNTHLEFLSSIPTRLGDLSSGSSSSTYKLPSVDVLESTPIAPLIAAHPAYKARPSASTAASNGITQTAVGATASSSTPASTSTGKPAKKSAAKKLPSKLPPSIAALPEDKRPAPDPERWLPKRERKGYADVMAAKQKEKEKKRLKARKKIEASMTQGSSSSAPAEAGKQQQGVNRPNNQQQQQNKKKKKKGGK